MLRENLEEEAILMKDVPGWKVKTGSLLCHVRNEDAWINYFTHFVREPFVVLFIQHFQPRSNPTF